MTPSNQTPEFFARPTWTSHPSPRMLLLLALLIITTTGLAILLNTHLT